MCGNGLRCVAKLVFDSALRHGHKDRALVIDTGRGPMPITICDADEKGEAQIVQVDMRVPLLEAQLIPCTKPGGVATELSLELRPGGKAAMQFIAIGNGVPHCVVFIDTLKIEEQGKPEKTFSTVDDVPVHLLGPSIEQLSHLFPKRTNVEFVQVVNESSVIQRTWERGAGETLACGSGSCATVVAGILSKRLRASSEKPVTVRLRGGELNISWAGPDSPVLMKGPAKTVYQGQLNLCPPPWPSA